MNSYRRFTVLIGLAGVLLTLSAVKLIAADKTNFSGNWKLNLDKSDLGPIPPPTSMREQIEHKDPDLKVRTIVVGGPQGDLDYEAKYTTDGKESSNRFGGQTAKSAASWEGALLVIHTAANFGGQDVTIKGTWSLSADGKILKQSSHVSSPQGQFDSVYVFEKE